MKQRFYKLLVEDLCHYIYVKASNDVLQWRRAANSAQTPFQRASSGRNSSGRASGNVGLSKNEAPKAKSLNLEIVCSSNQQTYDSFANIKYSKISYLFDFMRRAHDESSNQAISNIVQCLALLNKLPETLEVQ